MQINYFRGCLFTASCLWHSFTMAQNATSQVFSMPPAPFMQAAETTLQNDSPPIIYRDKPSILVWIEGEPVITVDTSLRMYRLLNSPHLIIKNHNDNKYYLHAGPGWYVSDSATTGYVYRKKLPPVIHLMDSLVNRGKPKTLKRTAPPVVIPQIVISSEPAALIYTNGKPLWVNITGTELAYAQNTPDNILKDTTNNNLYIVLAGRWYRSDSSFNGPWKYCSGNQLPVSFAKIPENTPKAELLTYIPGTKLANDAVAKAREFRTNKIPRGIDSTVSVVYDGGPELASLFGSELFIAQNSNIPVVNYREYYYALKAGVWYRSTKVNGPWEPGTQVPPDIDKLPSDNPLYYTRFVHITDTTGNFIETGYTAGYNHTYIQNNTVVFGTGIRYNQWKRTWFIPRPVTWLQGLSYQNQAGYINQPLLNYYSFTLP